VRVNLFVIPLNCLGKRMKRRLLYSRGKYFIRKRYSNKFKWHLEVMNVESRKFIPDSSQVNNALLELNGCIAPVTQFQTWFILIRKAFIN
jgi:hypothetical protein